MKSISITLMSIWMLTTSSFAGDLISETKRVCSTKSKETIQKKLQSVEKFHLIDNNLADNLYDWAFEEEQAFFSAKLLHSTKLGVSPDGTRTLIKFVIEPAPILFSDDSHLDLYPSVKAWCSYANSKFLCTKAGKHNRAIDQFTLSIAIEPTNSENCASGIDLDIQYEIQVNDDDYKEIVNLVQEKTGGYAQYIQDLDDQAGFFTSFFNAFLHAFETVDFEN